MIPSASVVRPSSAPEQSIPWLSVPWMLVTPIRRPPGRIAPGNATGTRWPTTTEAHSEPMVDIDWTSMPSSVSRSARRSTGRSKSTYSRSHEIGIRISCRPALELAQEAHVVLEERPNVRHAVTQAGDPVHTHAEGEALIAVGVEA